MSIFKNVKKQYGARCFGQMTTRVFLDFDPSGARWGVFFPNPLSIFKRNDLAPSFLPNASFFATGPKLAGNP